MRRSVRWWKRLAPALLLSFGLVADPGTVARAEDAPAKEAPAWRPFLWVVEGKPRIYLFGTIHVPDPRLKEKPAVLKDALDGADVLWTEIRMDDASMAGMVGRVMLPEGESLDTIVPKELYERVRTLFKAKGLGIEPFARLKVWALAATLGQLDYLPQMATQPPLDKELYKSQEDAKKEVDGLETVGEQLDVFDSRSREQQLKFLEQSVTQLEKGVETGKSPVVTLMEHYLAGDEDKMVAMMSEGLDPNDADGKALMKALLDDRNVRMVDRILERTAASPDKTYFVAVGAAHYPGPNGILDLLKKKGKTVRRLEVTDKIPAKAPAPKEPAPVK